MLVMLSSSGSWMYQLYSISFTQVLWARVPEGALEDTQAGVQRIGTCRRVEFAF